MNKHNSQYAEDLKRVQLPPLKELSGCNILVAGATGLVGSTLVSLLLLYADEYGYDVYAGCRSKEKFAKRFTVNNPRLHYLQLDVVQSLNGETQFQYIIHAASGASPRSFATDPVGVMQSNLLGTVNLLDYGVSHGCKKFLFVSTGEVYGHGCKTEWNESDSGYIDTMSARSCYPSSKRAAETLCSAYSEQYGIETSVARLCHTYGSCFTSEDNRVYAQFIRNVQNGEDIVLKSKGTQYRSWLYVVDAAAALVFILLRGANAEAYNVANEESNITIKQLAETIAHIAKRKVVYDIPEVQNVDSEPIAKAVFNTSKLEALGWKPLFGIVEGLTHSI